MSDEHSSRVRGSFVNKKNVDNNTKSEFSKLR